MNASSCTQKVIRSLGAFHEFRALWNKLAAASSFDSVFVRHEWFDAVLSWHEDPDIFIILVYRDERLIGIVPLQCLISQYRGFAFRTLTFLAVPDTQACGIIAADNDLPQVLNSALSMLADNRDWDILDLRLIPHDNQLVGLLPGTCQRAGLRYILKVNSSNYRIDCSNGSWDGYYKTRSRRLKKGNNLIVNKLGKAIEGIEMVHHRNISEHDLEKILPRIISISAASWKRSTGLSLDNPAPKRFIKCLSRHAMQQGWFSAWELNLDGQPVAMEYQLCYGKRIFALRSDFRDDFERLSPGTYLNFRIIQSLFGDDSEVESYLMGPGDNPYKMRWATHTEDLYRATLYNRTLRGRAAALLETRIKPLLQHFIQNKEQQEN
ncbi:MAG: hypothetical protein BMS9Abin09_0256 [Gammaproteobacteria bacterium]|nr:MAG: hypothetical protein BMS9Abin09_0256 [Gammaproteobacteria bacterium]